MKYLAIIVIFCSCSTEYLVDERLKTYVDEFYVQGAKRGKKLPKDNLVITLKKGLYDDGSVLGVTYLKDHRLFGEKQIKVFIDEAYFYRDDIESDCKETIIFHELGHALLNRGHSDQNISIMHTNSRYHCYKMDYYNKLDRDVMLDELFNNMI